MFSLNRIQRFIVEKKWQNKNGCLLLFFLQVRKRGRWPTPVWTESPVAPTASSSSNWLRLLLTPTATTFSRFVKTLIKSFVFNLFLELYLMMVLAVRIKTRWLSVSCAWWTWQEVSGPVGPEQKAPVYVKQVRNSNNTEADSLLGLK